MSRKNCIISIILIFMLFSSGCEDLNNPGEPKIKISFFYNLQVYDTVQKAYVYRVTDISGKADFRSADPYYNLFEKNAEITIMDLTDSKTTNFKLTQDTLRISPYMNPYKPCYISSMPFHSKPKSEFYLHANAGGNIITGKATAPGDFEISSPREGEVIKGYQSLRNYIFRWSSSKDARVYIASFFIKIKDDYMEGSYWMSYETMNTEMSFFLISWPNANVVQTGEFILRVEAFDDNYYQHYYNKKASVGLNGAYGCFSTSVVKEVKFIYKVSL